jgi:hypothetical protein
VNNKNGTPADSCIQNGTEIDAHNIRRLHHPSRKGRASTAQSDTWGSVQETNSDHLKTAAAPCEGIVPGPPKGRKSPARPEPSGAKSGNKQSGAGSHSHPE